MSEMNASSAASGERRIVNGSVHEFVQWYDTNGNIINASDGGMIYVDGVYHWYGLALRPMGFAPKGRGGQTTTKGVVMYRSTDLSHWEYEGVILACSDDENSVLRCPMRFERPKILYNQKTGKYVLWCHFVGYPGDHGTEIGTSEAGLAICDTVNGAYQWLGYTRPIDDKGLVRDCTVYQDHDGQAYFIYDRMEAEKNRCQYIVRLSDDYLSMTNDYRRLGEAFWREAAAIVYHDGYYFMITSDLTSWAPNQAKYFRSKTLFGPWETMGDPCIGDLDHTTFHSQSTWIFRVEGTDLWIHMAERHNTENFERCSYIWLPIHFTDDHKLYLSYEESWVLPEVK